MSVVSDVVFFFIEGTGQDMYSNFGTMMNVVMETCLSPFYSGFF